MNWTNCTLVRKTPGPTIIQLPIGCEKKYPKGASVRVYYNPQSPGTATLMPGLRGWNYASIIVNSLIALGGLALLLHAVWRTARFIRQAFH